MISSDLTKPENKLAKADRSVSKKKTHKKSISASRAVPPWMLLLTIFITGNVVDMDTRIFLEKSGVLWLSKPFLPADLEKIVNQTVALAGDTL